MLTDPDKQARTHRGSAHKKDDIDKRDPTQGIPVWLQPFTINLEDLETSSERVNSNSEGAASNVETPKTEA